MKLNVDAALDIGRRRVGCGAVVRDHAGYVLASAAIPVEAAFSPQTAEALAVLHGVILCARLGFSSVIVESDCQNVCRALTQRTPLYADYGNILADVLVLAGTISVLCFNHCKRAANTIAHDVAKFALSCNSSQIWWPGLPSCLYP